MSLSKYRTYSKLLYKDRFDIQRYIDIENEDGSTSEALDPNPKLKNIPCKISKVKEDIHNLNIDDINKESTKLKIFCSPDEEVLKGDLIIAELILDGKSEQRIKAIAGKPIKYNINQEFILIEDGEA
ncbi:MAG: hypothetical protein E7C86_03725 [Paeniclostridium sordellii]|nr:hypothetical protein [Paeniclostridium sordellii]